MQHGKPRLTENDIIVADLVSTLTGIFTLIYRLSRVYMSITVVLLFASMINIRLGLGISIQASSFTVDKNTGTLWKIASPFVEPLRPALLTFKQESQLRK